MGSKRKVDSDNNTSAPDTSATKKGDPVNEESQKHNNVRPGKGENEPSAKSSASYQTQADPVKARSSWYGSWRSKSSPVAQIARESISVTKGTTSESSSEAAGRLPGSVSKSARGRSRKSIPLAAEPTCVHVTSGGKPIIGEKSGKSDEGDEPKPELPATAQEQPEEAVDTAATRDENVVAQPPAASWFGWWSRPDGYGSEGENPTKRLKQDADTTSNAQNPNVDHHGHEVMNSEASVPPEEREAAQDYGSQLQPEMVSNAPSSRSWFGIWSSTQANEVKLSEPQTEQSSDTEQQNPTISRVTEDHVETNASSSSIPEQPEDKHVKPTAWAFWSTGKVKDVATDTSTMQKQVGELAVAGTPSQSKPEAAQFNEHQSVEPSHSKSSKASRKRVANKSLGTPSGLEHVGQGSAAPPILTPPDANQGPRGVLELDSRDTLAQIRPNLVLPKFRDTYRDAPNPSYIERISQYLAQSLHLPGSTTPYTTQRIFRTPSPPIVKKAVALGVHGFFPAPLIQKVLGQPTGTSIKFANFAAASVKRWCHKHQPNVKDLEVETVALEGEGYIADRVSTLWKLLLNWLSHLRQADFIFVACHSQGVPVAMMLVSKLIQLRCLKSQVRIGVCAMAGINLGPFAEFKSRLFGGSALELFEFCSPDSRVSKAYTRALDICLRHDVRITFVGSIDDQLVSLESSLHMPLSHPYVCRAVFVDGRLYAANFLTHLVAFALKLRNLGLSDHGLVRELSAPLAGSLVGGEGHSRIYDDPAVYSLAVAFTLESTDAQPVLFANPSTDRPERGKTGRETASARRASLGGATVSASVPSTNATRRGSLSASAELEKGIAPQFASYEIPANSANSNPFYLPWAVRGVLEEEMVKREMAEEVRRLVKEFEEWKPTSKVLRDVKWRLEGVRSMV